MNSDELFKCAYATAHMAADKISAMESGLKPLDRSNVREALMNANQAACALRELDNILAGNKTPRRGD